MSPASASSVSQCLGQARQCFVSGRLGEAETAARQALALAPNDPNVNHIAGAILGRNGKADEGLMLLRKAIQLTPCDPSCHNTLGSLLQSLGASVEAEAAFRNVLALQPAHPEALRNLGTVLVTLDRHEEAVGFLRQALRLRPNYPKALYYLGQALEYADQPTEGLRLLRQVVPQPLGDAASQHTLANMLARAGYVSESLPLFRAAVTLDPQSANAHSNLIYNLHYPYPLDVPALFDEHLKWAARHADPLTPPAPDFADLARRPDRRLRVGYVSRFFRRHSVQVFVEPILAHHDPAQVEVFCYSDVRAPDAVTARLRTLVAGWRDTAFASDEQVARQVRSDKIDILVDLGGHMGGGSRLLTFARKPAPLQATYIGYQNTTGMRAMDYRITDAIADPPGQTDPYYTEQLLRLPESFFCYQPEPAAPDPGPLPALARGHVTFACLNNLAKINPQVIAVWARILHAVAGARIKILVAVDGLGADYVLAEFARHGLGPDRVEPVRRTSHVDFFARHRDIDIALDPFPFSGHTSTCDALWMGVPVLTLAGEAYVSRMSTSVLHYLGLPEAISHSQQEYVDNAVKWAGDLPRLAQLRASLRQTMRTSLITDSPRFTRHLEAAYRTIWQRWCAAHP